jgi:hypothetical protein
LSLVTLFDSIVSFNASAQGILTSIYKYRARMFDYYKTVIDKNQVRYLNITKQDLMSIFIDPRIKLQQLVNNKRICMDWFIQQHFKDKKIDRCFMVFNKRPYNNKKVPLYFLRKLWAKSFQLL